MRSTVSAKNLIVLVALTLALWIALGPLPFTATHPATARSAAVVLITLVLWATGVFPPFLTSLIFFALVIVFRLARPELIFSGFGSAAVWLIVSGFVIGRDPLDEFGGFTLDCGTVNGVAVSDAVISDKGYLVGVVVEADTTSCKVMTVLHPSFNAAGVVSRTRENGILTGSTDYAGDGLCVLTNLERAAETQMGDQVITTGLGGVFPPDVLVGVVQKMEPEVSGKSSVAVIRPGAYPRTVKHVFVITDY